MFVFFKLLMGRNWERGKLFTEEVHEIPVEERQMKWRVQVEELVLPCRKVMR